METLRISNKNLRRGAAETARVFPLLFRRCAGFAAGFFFSACGALVDVNVTVVDQKTALENQILGSYKELGGEMLQLASVRSVDANGRLRAAAEAPRERMLAVKAMQRMEFNRDDIQQFKLLGLAGEGSDGMLHFFDGEKTRNDAKYKAFAETVLKEENADRQAVLRRIIATNVNFSESDLPKVQKIYAGLNRDNAKPGEKIQLDDGSWTVKR